MISVFFLYVLLTNITVMNMLIGIVCEVVAEVKQRDEKNSAVDYLKRNLRELLIELDNDQNGQLLWCIWHVTVLVVPLTPEQGSEG